MGYYSDVKLSTTKEGWEKLQKYIKDRTDETYVLHSAQTATYGAGAYVVASWQGIKWYDSFTDVHEFMNGLSMLAIIGIPYEYVRVSEDNEDIEQEREGKMLDGMKRLGVKTIIEEW